MKKFTFLGAALLSVMCMNAQEVVSPIILPNWGVNAISANNVYASGTSFSAKTYNLQTGVISDAGALEVGLGNFLSNNGGMVGNTEQGAALVYLNGKTYVPETLASYWFCNINAITPDETRICGTINNPQKGGLDYIPFYCDLDENGNIGEAQLLPYPTEDFTGNTPQFASALYISADGNTILGMVNDWKGEYDYPIIYTQDNSGNWSYSLPTADLFNPDHAEFPVNPWLDEPPFPEPENFMSPQALEAYEKAREDAFNTGTMLPNPVDYLTDEQYDVYAEAVEEYNVWFNAHQTEFKDYNDLYYYVLSRSYQFPLNEIVLSPDGSKFACTSIHDIFGGPTNDQVIGTASYIYIYEIENEGGNFVSLLSDWIQPSQILDDGTVLAAYPVNSAVSNLPTDSFIITSGSNDIIPLVDYWEETMPEYAEWTAANINDGVGYVLTNSDMSIYIGTVDEFNFDPNKPGVFTTLAAAAYIFGVDEAGVESIVADSSDYKIYNLQGVNVLNTKDKNEINQLPAGIYIVNGKKILISK